MEWQLMQRKKVFFNTTLATLATQLNVDNLGNVARKRKLFFT